MKVLGSRFGGGVPSRGYVKEYNCIYYFEPKSLLVIKSVTFLILNTCFDVYWFHFLFHIYSMLSKCIVFETENSRNIPRQFVLHEMMLNKRP